MTHLLERRLARRSELSIVQGASKWALRWSSISLGTFAAGLITLVFADSSRPEWVMKSGIILSMASVFLHAVAAGAHSNVYLHSRRARRREPTYATRPELHRRVIRTTWLQWFGATMVMIAAPIIPFAYLLPLLWGLLFGLTVGLFLMIRDAAQTTYLLVNVEQEVAMADETSLAM